MQEADGARAKSSFKTFSIPFHLTKVIRAGSPCYSTNFYIG